MLCNNSRVLSPNVFLPFTKTCQRLFYTVGLRTGLTKVKQLRLPKDQKIGFVDSICDRNFKKDLTNSYESSKICTT